ncbi:MAG: DEAD/DEAH box helicase family protein [Actinomycetota bacterium]|nr:DEAD/DEAH box helicase family protein [Actinomycetota bacterium]
MTAAERTLRVDDGAIDAIASRLDLREPNREALRSIAHMLSQHVDVEGRPPPFEAVVDAATGVGKTYIIAAAIEYYAERGHRNFAVVTPGRTILEKTVANFTAGHPKSLLGGMEVEPLLVTGENFATVDHAEPERVRLYVFTVQSLTKPSGKQGKRTHSFHESLGDAFYSTLQGFDDLVLFADEHHVYYGPAFSDAVRDLRPHALVGLTATPHKKTPHEQLIYRYPLAAAIADRLVKTPVLVGRKDDRGGETQTKLQDGIRLLEAKRAAMEKWCTLADRQPVNPILLVIAQTIEGAEEIAALVKGERFFEGRYADSVLTVHSKAPDDALAALEHVEDPESPVRIIVSVGMLKEGWDVKNVYAICSLRPLLSDVLTEQTLGRGLRLPWGEYTGVPLLDTLEVLAHDRYEALLKKTSAINEEFVDYRTRLVVRRDAEGNETAHVETTPVDVEIVIGERDGAVGIAEQDAREGEAAEELQQLNEELRPRGDLPALEIPRLRMTKVQLKFSLADITELNAFEALGRRLASEPEDDLRRMELGARIVTGSDGLRRTELVTTTGDRIVSQAEAIPLETARAQLLDALLGAEIVPPHASEASAARHIVDAFLRGLGDGAERVLSAYLDRAAASLVGAVTAEHRRFVGRPEYDEVIETSVFAPVRVARAKRSENRSGAFERSVGYEGWTRSMYVQVWFDSSTERTLATILDDADDIRYWVRLNTGDLPILWQGDGREYNPDFIALDSAGTHWLVESKMDKELESSDVKGKENAALRWANHVSAKTGVAWRYLLVGETDIATARGSWSALRGS